MMHDYRDNADRANAAYGNDKNDKTFLTPIKTAVDNLSGGYAGTVVHPGIASITASNPLIDTKYEPNISAEPTLKAEAIKQSLRPFFDDEYSILVSKFFLHLYDDNNVTFDIKNRNKELFLYENVVENIAPYNVFVEKVYDFIEGIIKKTNVSLSVLINALYKLNSKSVIKDLTELNVQTGGDNDNSDKKLLTNKLVRMVASEFDTWFCSDCQTENTYNHFLSAQDDILQQSILGEGPASSKSNADISIYKAVREIMCSNVEKRYQENNNEDIQRIINYVEEVKNNSKNKFIIDNSAKKFPFKDKYNNEDCFNHEKAKKFAKDNTMCIQSTLDDGITSNFSFGHSCAVKDKKGIENDNMSMNIIFKSKNKNRSVQYIRDADEDKWCIIWKHGKEEWGAKLRITNTGLSSKVRLKACVEELYNFIGTSTFNTLTPEQKKRQIAIIAYSQLSFKLLGDLLQEIDGTFKNGGRVNAPTYPGGVTGVEPFDTNGDSKRLVISTDQPSAARLMWMFYNGNNYGSQCKGQSSDWRKYLNKEARGGYYNHITYVIQEKDKKQKKPLILGTAKCQYFIYDPIGGIVAHSEKNTLVPHKSKINVGRLFTNMLSSFENYQKQLYHRFVYRDYLIQRYTFYYDNQCYETDTIKGYINNMPDFLNSLSYVENPIIEIPHPVLLNILNERLLLADMQVKDIGNIIYNPNRYGFQDCTNNLIQSTAYGYNNLQSGFDVINIIPKNSRITFTYHEGSSEELHLAPYGPNTNVRKRIKDRVFIEANINGNQVTQFNIDDKEIILNTQYYLLDSVREQNRIMQKNVDQFLLDIVPNVYTERLGDVNSPPTDCIDECINTTNVTHVSPNTTPSSSTPGNSNPAVTCKFENGKYLVTIDGNQKEFDTKPTSSVDKFHEWVKELYPTDISKRQSIYKSITDKCKGTKRKHTGGASTIQQETYQDPLTYAIVAIGAFAAMMIGLQK